MRIIRHYHPDKDRMVEALLLLLRSEPATAGISQPEQGVAEYAPANGSSEGEEFADGK